VTTVLITDITSYKAAVIARHLRQWHPDVKVLATDHRRFARVIHTRHAPNVIALPCAPEAGEAYAAALGRVIAQTGVDLVIPVNSKEIRVLAHHRRHLGDTLDYMGSNTLYQRLDDKSEFAKLVHEAGLPQPLNYETLDAPLPLVVKPSRGSSSMGVTYLFSEEQRGALKAKLGSAPKGHVIQEFIEGEGIGYSGYFESGKPLVAYAHRRIAEYPATGGSSVLRERYPYDDANQLEAVMRKMLKAAPWSGFAMFELKRRGPGDFIFIECNPRIWGSIHQGLADGANYFAPLLGAASRTHAAPSGQIRTALLPLNLLAAAGYVRMQKYKPLREMTASFASQRLDINPFSDPLGFAALLMRGA
jgi:predicted ATP-grasp superfamily ATP-dependent carboligase